jgi:hypothetical protein
LTKVEQQWRKIRFQKSTDSGLPQLDLKPSAQYMPLAAAESPRSLPRPEPQLQR